MSVLARRSKLLMWFDGVNISDDIAPYFLTATYTDNDDGVACLYLPTFNGDGVILGAIKT